MTSFVQKCTFIPFKAGIDLRISFAKTSDEEIVCDDFEALKVFNELLHSSLTNFGSAGMAEKHTSPPIASKAGNLNVVKKLEASSSKI